MKFALITAVAVGILARAANAAEMPAADANAFQSYLTAQRLTERWSGPPTAITSDEIRRAYPGSRFYFTYQREPLPPGAPLPELIAAYDKAHAEYRKRSLQITVGIDQSHDVHPFRGADDFNHNLMPVRTAEDAGIAAAAILSLMNEPEAPPAVIAAHQIRVERAGDAWLCRLQGVPNRRGEIAFDASGKCVRVAKQSTAPREVPR